MGEAFGTLMRHVSATGALVVGPPFRMYAEMPSENMTFLVALPVAPGELPARRGRDPRSTAGLRGVEAHLARRARGLLAGAGLCAARAAPAFPATASGSTGGVFDQGS